MNGLEVPPVPAGVDVDGDDGVGVQVGAGPVSAPVVARGRAEGRVEDVALLVEREIPTPVIDALPVLPTLVQPARVILVTGLGDGHEIPEFGPGTRVERLRVARTRALRDFAVVRADDDDVLIDQRNAAPVDPHVDEAAVPER